MRAVRVVLILFVLIFAAAFASVSEPRPLVLDFMVDPKVRARFSSDSAFNDGMADIVSRASLIFNAEVGRRLKIGEIRVGLPNGAGEELYAEQVFQWLGNEKRSRHFFVFIIGRTLRWGRDFGPMPLEGAASRRSGLMITTYYSAETQHAVSIFLHELGHLCGAEHSERSRSIMSPARNNSLSFGEQASVIRDNCGER